MLSRHFFWQTWEQPKQTRFFRLAFWGWTAALVILWSIPYFMTQTDNESITSLRKRYTAVAPLAREMQILRAARGDLAEIEPAAAALQAVADVGVDLHSIFLSTVSLKGGDTELHLSLDGLTLTQLTDTLETLRTRCALHWTSFTLSRNPVDERLADVAMVLSR